MYLNKVTIIGNLTRDPELKVLPSGTKVVKFSVATNRVYYDQSKQKVEEVEYHNLVAFGRTAEIVGDYLLKGSQCCVEGRLHTSTWDDKDTDKKMYRTEIMVESLQLGSRPKDGGDSNRSYQKPQREETSGIDNFDDADDQVSKPAFTRGSGKFKPPQKKTGSRKSSGVDYPDEELNAEDIPF